MNTADILVQQTSASISTWTFSYYLWISTFYVLCVATIVMPGIVALNLLGNITNRILAGLTAAIVALMTWSNLGSVGTGFDTARRDLRLALIQYDLDKDKTKLFAAYQRDQVLVGGLGPSAVPGPSQPPPPPAPPVSK